MHTFKYLSSLLLCNFMAFLLSVSVQFSSVAQSCLTLWNPMNCSTPGLPVHHQLPDSPRLMSIESVMPSSQLILCWPLLLLPPIPPSLRVFSNESTLRMRWPKCWSFSFSIIPSKEIPGLISFRMYWLDLLAVQGTLKSPLHHHSSKAIEHYHCIKIKLEMCVHLHKSNFVYTQIVYTLTQKHLYGHRAHHNSNSNLINCFPPGLKTESTSS